MSVYTEQPVLITSITAAEDLSTAKNLFIGYDGKKCLADKKALGVAMDTALINEQIPVATSGIKLVLSGGVISAGDAVVCNANSKAVKATAVSVSVPSGATAVTSTGAQPTLTVAGSDMPQHINGYALDASTGADQLIRVKLV